MDASNRSAFTPSCNGSDLNDAERPVITWLLGIGIAFVVLGRRILDGKPGVSQREATGKPLF